MSANVLIQQPDQPELIGMQVTASFRRAARFLAEQDEVYSDFDNDRWVMVFLETDSSSESLQKKNIQFKLAKDAFLSQPHRTIEILEEFASCLATDDLVANFLLQLHNQGPNTVKCWLEIQSLFNSYFETSEDNSPASEDDSINVDDNNLSAQIQEFGDLAQIVRGCKIDGGGGEKASRQVQDFIDKTQEMHQKRLKSLREIDRTHLARLSQVLTPIICDARKKSPNETDWIVKHFSSDQLPTGEDNTTIVTLYDNLLEGWSVKSSLLALNLIEFAVIIIGCDPNEILTKFAAISKLRNAADDKKRQWGIFYDTIERLQGSIDEQKQIIASLEYRHVLEKLPQTELNGFKTVDQARRRHDTNPQGGSSGAWHTTWEMACRNEITHMVQLANKTPTETTQQPLELLLRYDFDKYWAAPKRRPNLTMNGHFQDPYMKWPSYQYGRNLFGLLSDNIHGHGRTYEVDERNWPKLYHHLFQWLKPTVGVNGDVDWQAEWTTSKGLSI